jgi:hypothetical protein
LVGGTGDTAELPAVSVPAPTAVGLDWTFARLFRRSADQLVGVHSVLTSMSADVSTVLGTAKGGLVKWTRHEALATVVDAAFVDLPPDPIAAGAQSTLG